VSDSVPTSRRPGRDPGAAGGDEEAIEVATDRRRGFGSVLAFTVLGAVLPGTAHLAAGRRKVGATLLVLFLLLVGAGVWLATGGRQEALRLAVDTAALRWVLIGAAALGLVWLVVVVTGYRALLPRGSRPWQKGLGALVVALLCAGVAGPAYLVVQFAAAQRGLVDNVFADRESATVTTPAEGSEPFGNREQVNFLLLGGDGGVGREGVRTDTVIVANVQVESGRTTLFSLPRNLEDLPFPADSPLAEVYPDGFEAGSEAESLLNAVYRNGPEWYPDVLGPTDDPGADFLKLGVGEALGLDIDYFVLVNLEGFARLVDALGGITVNVNYFVPVNGIEGQELPDAYIAPGPDQHMDGTRALDYARGRYGLSDYLRMDRQRCVIDAIVDAADPVTVLSRYRQLAATTQDIVSTDLPQSLLDDVVDLAFRVKGQTIRSVVFDDTVIDPAYPDYDLIRSLVQQALADPTDTAPASTAPSAAPSTAPAPVPTGPAAPTSAGNPAVAVTDVCAYDPVQAQAAREAGEPPTKQG
jgi:LCP family protein required for cell wall assembly